MIIVCPLNKAEDLTQRHGVSHIISLLSPDTPHRSFGDVPRDRHLKLTFHDIVQASDGLQLASATDTERLVSFVKAWPRDKPMLIHCWAGISRSTAAAYTALCMLRPDMDEEELAWELREAAPSATPNRLIVSRTDQLLARQGRMLRAIEKIGRGADAFEGTPFTLNP